MSGVAISSVAASLSSPNVHTVDFASLQALRSLQAGFLASLVPNHNF